MLAVAAPALAALALAAPAQAAQSAQSAQATHTLLHATSGVTGSLPASTKFYINPNSNVEQWVAANPTNADEPTIAADIASQPQATWFTTYNPTTIESQVSSVSTAAAAAGEVPVLVAYDIPDRDCGGASAGGAPTIADYEAWISSFAAGLGAATAIVLVEPDSLALQTCLTSSEASQRDAAIAYAGQVIRADDPNARVYFDGGHSDWNPASQQAAALEAADVRDGDLPGLCRADAGLRGQLHDQQLLDRRVHRDRHADQHRHRPVRRLDRYLHLSGRRAGDQPLGCVLYPVRGNGGRSRPL
jgi:endoglucanase